MGKGKGSFDHWASRIAVSKVIFELKGDIHEQVARDAFRLAGNKMPGKPFATQLREYLFCNVANYPY
jgi:ribosomal protein L16/L10AE